MRYRDRGDGGGSINWKNIGVLQGSWAVRSLLVRVMGGSSVSLE